MLLVCKILLVGTFIIWQMFMTWHIYLIIFYMIYYKCSFTLRRVIWFPHRIQHTSQLTLGVGKLDRFGLKSHKVDYIAKGMRNCTLSQKGILSYKENISIACQKCGSVGMNSCYPLTDCKRATTFHRCFFCICVCIGSKHITRKWKG